MRVARAELVVVSCCFLLCPIDLVSGEHIRSRNAQFEDMEWDVASFPSEILRRSDPYNNPRFSSDETDFYFPFIDNGERGDLEDAFPLVVFLQGALADKQHFSNFAERLASHGYVVLVPNHLQVLDPINNPDKENMIASQWTVNDALEAAMERDADQGSPLFKIIDAGSIAVRGHSFRAFGGAAAMFVVAGASHFPFCGPPPPYFGYYELPSEVKAAAVTSTHLLVATRFFGSCPCDPDDPSTPYPGNQKPLAIITGSLDDPDCTNLSYDGTISRVSQTKH